MEPYRELEERFARIADLNGAYSVLLWDRATMMPEGGAETRTRQMTALSLVTHDFLTDPRIGELLDQVEAGTYNLDEWQAANLREMRREWRRATALPTALVEAFSNAEGAAEAAWRRARAEDDFALFCPHLETLVALTREKAAVMAEAFGCTPYDALLDSYDPGARVEEVDALFDDLGEFIPPFLEEVLERQASEPPPKIPDGAFPVERQRDVARAFMIDLGFDFDHGRLDDSLHPFTSGVPGDVRITTRYDTAEFAQGLMAVLHETGHALYEMHLPPDWRGQPVGRALGMTIHESQSLIVEMVACRSLAFVEFAAPRLRAAFGGGNDDTRWSAENLRRLYHKVERSLIRVYADEVTYPLHVILRYRLERALLDGGLAVRHLPDAWSNLMGDLVGVIPDSDRNGCLQDIHWAKGNFGYFPTYTLGALLAAQLFEAAERTKPGIEEAIRSGDFRPLTAYLNEYVHACGRRLERNALIEHATGAPLGTAAFKRHLTSRYLGT